MYNNLNDYEQLYLISENDDYAKELIFKKYKPIVISIANKYYSYMKGRYDIEDFIQEGYIGLNRAINSFSEDKDALFYTFSIVCIERQIQSYFRKICALKNFHFNNSYSLDIDIDGSLISNSLAEENDINDPFVNSTITYFNEYLIKFKNNLSLKQSCVFELR